MRIFFLSEEEFKVILKLPGSFVLQKALSSSGLVGVPAELWPSARELGLLALDEILPRLVNMRLVQKAVNDPGVHPLSLGQARLKMARDMFNVALTGGMQCRAESTGPVLAFAQVLDDFLGVRARLATVALFVMLVEGVGPPEASVAARFRARVLSPALMELIFVPFPVILALEASLTRRTPIYVLSTGTRGC